MAEEKRPTLTLPKKRDERAEFLALQDSVHAQKPRDGALTPEQLALQTKRPERGR